METGEQQKQKPDEDFGLEDKIQDYHRHGGAEGDAKAKKLEGDIGATIAQHEHHLKKGRPDGTPVRRK